MVSRGVFHIRLKELELQAERIIDPGLRTRPIAIVSSSNSNGTIVSLSSEAKEEGLFHGMKVSIARKMSYGVQLLPYNHTLYTQLSQYIYQTISMFTPVVEPEGLRGFYLDMNGMCLVKNQIRNIGSSILKRVEDQTSVTGVLGISINKLVSRIITSVVPETIYEVPNGDEVKFLSPLRALVLPAVKENYIRRLLRFLWIEQVHQIQSMISKPDEFQIFFGMYAMQLFRQAQGKDSSIVKPPKLRDHILEQTIMPEDTNDEDVLHAVVKDLAGQVAFKLRQRCQISDKILLSIHYADGHHRYRIGRPISIDDISIIKLCCNLFDQANERRNRIRTILIDASHFRQYVHQENLFITNKSIQMSISKAVEKVRIKYGYRSLQTADVLQMLSKL